MKTVLYTKQRIELDTLRATSVQVLSLVPAIIISTKRHRS